MSRFFYLLLFVLSQNETEMSHMEKRIESLEMRVGDIKNGFGNPRKITKQKKEELQKSLEDFGDFGLILIDEHDNVIAGNQRISIMQAKDPNIKVLCKRLIGYTKSELRAINIKDNTHAGEWDLDQLADWTADLNMDLGLDVPDKPVDEHDIREMEPIHYEHYDYVVIACRNELDYNQLVRKLGIEDVRVKMCKTRSIKCRAIWYDQMKAQIVDEEEGQRLEQLRKAVQGGENTEDGGESE